MSDPPCCEVVRWFRNFLLAATIVSFFTMILLGLRQQRVWLDFLATTTALLVSVIFIEVVRQVYLRCAVSEPEPLPEAELEEAPDPDAEGGKERAERPEGCVA